MKIQTLMEEIRLESNNVLKIDQRKFFRQESYCLNKLYKRVRSYRNKPLRSLNKLKNMRDSSIREDTPFCSEEFRHGLIGNKTTNSSFGGSQSSSSGYNNSNRNSNSWDDWGEEKDTKKEAAPNVSTSNDDNDDDWAGWDDNDAKDDDFGYQSAGDKKYVAHNGKSDTAWTGGGFL